MNAEQNIQKFFQLTEANIIGDTSHAPFHSTPFKTIPLRFSASCMVFILFASLLFAWRWQGFVALPSELHKTNHAVIKNERMLVDKRPKPAVSVKASNLMLASKIAPYDLGSTHQYLQPTPLHKVELDETQNEKTHLVVLDKVIFIPKFNQVNRG